MKAYKEAIPLSEEIFQFMEYKGHRDEALSIGSKLILIEQNKIEIPNSLVNQYVSIQFTVSEISAPESAKSKN